MKKYRLKEEHSGRKAIPVKKGAEQTKDVPHFPEIQVEPVDQPQTIMTKFGKALAMPGNFVVTNEDGSQHVITPDDLEHFWEPV